MGKQVKVEQIGILILMALCLILGCVIGYSAFAESEKEAKEETEVTEHEVTEQYDSNKYHIDELEREVSELYNRLSELEKRITVTSGEAAYAKGAVDTLTDYLKERLEE